ncbi:isocitrate lyase/phosphoenolpyruvate mutase family protein [Peribacillus muralis]|uniref:isocitrate lyase/phosphoenolpyruvate mutase family protein n=1 Tax=Peribacillus muralis TaxID=264697 RepID=UPI003D08D457
MERQAGESIDFERHLSIIELIADHVKIPVSTDIEAGYGETAEMIVANALRAAEGDPYRGFVQETKRLRDGSQHCSLLS